jgi:hypothetical protein
VGGDPARLRGVTDVGWASGGRVGELESLVDGDADVAERVHHFEHLVDREADGERVLRRPGLDVAAIAVFREDERRAAGQLVEFAERRSGLDRGQVLALRHDLADGRALVEQALVEPENHGEHGPLDHLRGEHRAASPGDLECPVGRIVPRSAVAGRRNVLHRGGVGDGH